jgi:integral membrane protein
MMRLSPRAASLVPRRLRLAALLEGTTLLALIFVAVPLKHLAGQPEATTWLGPVHGGAFLFYLWTLVSVAVDERWSLLRTLGWGIAAVAPFGTFAAVQLHSQQEANDRRS